MSTLVIGGRGNMGRRYCSILEYLKQPYKVLDLDNMEQYPELASICHKFIIATPTDTHLEYIEQLLPFDCPILCEKPLSKDPRKLKEVLEPYEDPKLSMVVNYGYAFNLSVDDTYRYFEKENGHRTHVTSYDYYNSGNDGLIWDCIQLVNLADGPISLKNKSPVWEVMINGVPIKREVIDMSYVLMVSDFVTGHLLQDKNPLIELHMDVEKMHEQYVQGYSSEYWNPGEDDEQEVP
jgi:hypothetical protein